ncbi:MAG: YihY/virulence factor BrkB family protein [Cardiobacteriaceae bacterium]|nr:YihY/virulence factor BrkB family protein [Cardiobacteriaceae bacterium]
MSIRRIHKQDFIFIAKDCAKKASKKIAKIPLVLQKSWNRQKISITAQSLVFVTLLTLVPLLAVAVAFLHGFGIQGVIEPWLQKVFAPMGKSGLEVVGYLLRFVEQTNAANLGILGIIFLFFSVINIAGKIEDALNAIWAVKNTGGFHKRLSGYFSAILLAPLLITALMSSMLGMKNAAWLQSYLRYPLVLEIFNFLTGILPTVIVFLSLSAVYLLIPKIKVRLFSAASGAIFFIALWYPVSQIFSRFIAASNNYPAIYSGFAVLIILLFWLYYLWTIFLLGAVICVYMQNPNKLNITEWKAAEYTKLVLTIAEYLALKFERGEKPANLAEISRDLPYSSDKIEVVLEALQEANLWRQTQNNPPEFLPVSNPKLYSQYQIYRAMVQNNDEEENNSKIALELEEGLRKILDKPLI